MDKIFKWLTAYSEHPKTSIYLSWFCKSLTEREFDGIDLSLFRFLNFCNTLRVLPKRENLQSYFKTDLEIDVKKFNIKIESTLSMDYSQTSQLKESCAIIADIANKTFEMYISEDLSGREFATDVNEYFRDKQNELAQQIFMDFYPKLSDGSVFTNVSEEMRSALIRVEKAYDVSKIRDIELEDGKEDEDDMELEFVCNTGFDAIDGITGSGGIYTHLMTTINGQPGGGKTRFALVHYVYPVLTDAKGDVLFYETELSESQVKNILIAYHIVMLYGGTVKIPDSLMNRKREMTEDQRRIYEAAKHDLFKSGKYGKFICKTGCVVEELEDDLNDQLRINRNIKLVCIDYMGNIRSIPRSLYERILNRTERIDMAYEIVRAVLLKYNTHAVCINQFTKEGNEAADAGKPIIEGMIQGGQTSWRFTDFDLNITCTREQKLANVRMFDNGKVRDTAGFHNVMAKVDMSISMFVQQ